MPAHRKARPHGMLYRSPRMNAREGAGGPPPIVRAWSISNAASCTVETCSYAGTRQGPKKRRHSFRALPMQSKVLRRGLGRAYLFRVQPDGTGSIDVLLEAPLPFQLCHEQHSFVGAPRAELCDDIDQRPFDVFRHPLGVSTDIHVSTFGQPRPNVAADFSHAILDVKLLVPVPRPSQRQSGQQTGCFHCAQFVRIEEIDIAALMTEEQPVLTA